MNMQMDERKGLVKLYHWWYNNMQQDGLVQKSVYIMFFYEFPLFFLTLHPNRWICKLDNNSAYKIIRWNYYV